MSNSNNINKTTILKKSIRRDILAFALIPVVIFAIVVGIFFNTLLARDTEHEVKNNLRAEALTVLAAYNQNPGDYIEGNDGGLWKGNTRISSSDDMLMEIGETADIDISFYSKKQCVVTTMSNIEDSNMSFPKDIAKEVIEEQYDFYSNDYDIDGVRSYVYGIGVYQEGSDVIVGMIVVSADYASRNESKNNMLSILLVIMVLTIIAVSLIGFFMVNSITKDIKTGVKAIEKVSTGELRVTIKDKVINRGDEIGLMNKSLSKLVKELRKMIEKNIVNTNRLIDSANHLDSTATVTKESIEQVNVAMNMMSDTAELQYTTATKVFDNVEIFNEMLENTYSEIQKLSNAKDSMQNEGDKVKNLVNELMLVSDILNKVIKVINTQIETTHSSAKKIRKSAELIAEFADETNLLSLNAAIEAKRVGEQGKGFAIVANQIKELADQSTSVSANITDEIKELLHGSNNTLTSMEEVNQVVDRMSSNIDITEEVFGEINGGIDKVSGNVEVIRTRMKKMEEVSSDILIIIDELKLAAEKNSQCVLETSTVSDYMSELLEEASALKYVADDLAESMGEFKL